MKEVIKEIVEEIIEEHQNYVDARTPEERERDSKMKSEITYASSSPTESEGWAKEFDKRYSLYPIGDYSEQICPNSCEKEPIKDFIKGVLQDQRNKLIERGVQLLEIKKMEAQMHPMQIYDNEKVRQLDNYNAGYSKGVKDAIDSLALLKEPLQD